MSRGTLTVVFDDGYQHIFERVVPLLDELGLPGVFAVPLVATKITTEEGLPVTAWEEWLTLQAHGHEIAAHSINHVDLTTLSPADLDRELREPAEKLHATTLVYPGGAYNATVLAAAKRYYRAARTVRAGFAQHDIPFELATVNYTQRNFSVWKANARALWAYLTNRWLIETYHIVSDGEPTALHAVPFTGLASHLRLVRQLPLRVTTIRDCLPL